MLSSTEDYPNDCDNDRLPEIARLQFPVVGRHRNRPGSVSSLWAWSKTPGLPSKLQWYLSYCRRYKYFRFEWHIAISGYPSMSHLFVDIFYEFGVVESFVYRARITVILTSDLFGCISLWLWLCSRLLLPVTTSGFVRHHESVEILLFTLLASHLTIFRL